MTTLPAAPVPADAISRRRLLLTGATLAAGAAVGGGVLRGMTPMAGTLEGVVRAGLPSLSIGFVDRARPDGVLDLAGRPQFVPATAGRAGGLGPSATAHVAGPTPGALDALRAQGAGLQIDALFPPTAGGTEPVRFAAWTWRPSQSAAGGPQGPESASPPVRFTVPVGPMSLGFDVTASGSPTALGTGVLTEGAEAALARLRPGTYLLGLQPDVWASAGRLPAADDQAWRELASVVVVLTPAA